MTLDTRYDLRVVSYDLRANVCRFLYEPSLKLLQALRKLLKPRTDAVYILISCSNPAATKCIQFKGLLLKLGKSCLEILSSTCLVEKHQPNWPRTLPQSPPRGQVPLKARIRAMFLAREGRELGSRSLSRRYFLQASSAPDLMRGRVSGAFFLYAFPRVLLTLPCSRSLWHQLALRGNIRHISAMGQVSVAWKRHHYVISC